MGVNGSFRLDGSWWPEGPGEDALTRFCRSLIQDRRAGASPKQLAGRIVASGFGGLLTGDTLEHWGLIDDPAFWFAVPVSTCLQATLKYAVKDPAPTLAAAEVFLAKRNLPFDDALAFVKGLA